MDNFWQDVKYGARMLLKSRGVTLLAVLTLALGIGANTAIFSIVNAVLLRPLPYEQPEQLLLVYDTNQRTGAFKETVAYPNFRDWAEQNRVFSAMAGFRRMNFTLTGVAEPDRILGGAVSAGFFELLGVQPALGRTFRAEEDSGGQPVVVLTHGFWQRRFGGNPDAIGKTITLDKASVQVVGVLPLRFYFPFQLSEAELFLPMSVDRAFREQRGAHMMQVVARLKPGVTRLQAQAEMTSIAQELERRYPDYNSGRGVNLVPVREQMVGQEASDALLLLWGAVGFVLLIACANVANLLLARGLARERELVIRSALGAGRGRILRQLLTESCLLSLGGGVLGVLLALWSVEGLAKLIPEDVHFYGSVTLDPRVVGFAAALSVVTGLLFGLAPALYSARMNPQGALKEVGRGVGGPGRRRLRHLLLVAETAVAVVLLVGAGLLVRSFARLLSVDTGLQEPSKVLTWQMSVPFGSYASSDQRAAFYRQALERVSSIAGVRAAGLATTVPLGDSQLGISFHVIGRPQAPPGQGPSARYDSASPDYFRTLGIPLRRGRFFTEEDRRGRPGVMLINETMAQRYWPNEDPLGQKLQIGVGFGEPDAPRSYEIVGIVGDVRNQGLHEAVGPQFYVPYTQQTWPFAGFVVRTDHDPAGLIATIRREVAALTREEATFKFQTVQQYLDKSLASRRFSVFLLGVFAAAALVLAAVGIYGVMAFTVTQRTQEIGIRMALGAGRDDVLRLVLGDGLRVVLAGVAIGLPGAIWLTRFLRTMLFGVTANDPFTYAGAAALLVGVALAACYVPARRAARVDPMVALRYE